MKKAFIGLVILASCAAPSVLLASGLTNQQSESLIAVVQSSPGTPASAFVSLITSFSNISVSQAESLINVVQAAPGVPANAFVNLLVSFTYFAPTSTTSSPVEEITTVQLTNPSTAVAKPELQFLDEPKFIFEEISMPADCCGVNSRHYESYEVNWKTNLPARIEHYPVNTWATPPEKYSETPIRSYGNYPFLACSPWDAGVFYIDKEYICELNLITEGNSRIKWSKKFIFH